MCLSSRTTRFTKGEFMDSVTHDLNRYEREQDKPTSSAYIEAYKEFVYEKLLCDPLLLSTHTEFSKEQSVAIVRLYQGLPKFNGERQMYSGMTRIDELAWNLIDAITNNEIVQDAAKDYAAMVTGC